MPFGHSTTSAFFVGSQFHKEEIMAYTSNPVRSQEDSLKGKAQEMADTAKQLGDKYQDAASGLADKAKDVASTVVEKTKETASAFGQKAQDATHAVGRGMETLAGSVRQNLPQGGAIGTAASSVASGLQTGGQYLEKEGLPGIGQDVLNLIRRNPLPALFVGIGLGFILARATTTRS
jgi:gas vesicle protein